MLAKNTEGVKVFERPETAQKLLRFIEESSAEYVAENNEEFLKCVLDVVQLKVDDLQFFLARQMPEADEKAFHVMAVRTLVEKDQSRKEYPLYIREMLSEWKENRLNTDEKSSPALNIPSCLYVVYLLSNMIVNALQREQLFALGSSLVTSAIDYQSDSCSDAVTAVICLSCPPLISVLDNPKSLIWSLMKISVEWNSPTSVQDLFLLISKAWIESSSPLSTKVQAFTRLVFLVGMLLDITDSKLESVGNLSGPENSSKQQAHANLILLLQALITNCPNEEGLQYIEHLLFKVSISESQGRQEFRTFIFRSLFVDWFRKAAPSPATPTVVGGVGSLLQRLLADTALALRDSSKCPRDYSPDVAGVHSVLSLAAYSGNSAQYLHVALLFEKVRCEFQQRIMAELGKDGISEHAILELQVIGVSLDIMKLENKK
jgi:hypothetical protein